MIAIHLLWNVHEDKCQYLTSNELVKKARMSPYPRPEMTTAQSKVCLSPHGLILFKGKGGVFDTSQSLQ